MTDLKGFHQGSLYGIGVETRLNLPLRPEAANPTIKIKKGRISRPRQSPIYQNDQITVYKEPGAAVTVSFTNTLLKIDSREIIVDCDDACDPDLLVFFAWPLLLSLLGRECLHGCVVERNGWGLAVLGASGSGKSTTALRLVELGLRMVADDLVVFNNEFEAVPGPPFIRLRPDQAPGQEGWWDQGGKFRCTVPVCNKAAPIRKIIVLDEEFKTIAPVRGAKAADLLVRYLASSYVLFPKQAVNRFKIAVSVANSIPIYGAQPRSLDASQLAALANPDPDELKVGSG